jgi:hypothetical protein
LLKRDGNERPRSQKVLGRSLTECRHDQTGREPRKG